MFADRRRLIIGGAVVVVLGLAAWFVRSPAGGSAAPAGAARPRAGQAPNRAVADAVQPLNLEALLASRGEPNETLRRNPFRFQPKVVAPPRPAVAPIADTAPRPMVPTAPAGPPQPPPIALKFIAILERANGVKWAVLSDGKSPPMYGRDGDAIDGRYRIVKIGTESVELTYLDGRGRQVVRLSGQ